MENTLFDKLTEDSVQWRKGGYACADYTLIGEILVFQKEAQEDSPALKFLREPQFAALETYWYVRLKLKTPHIIDLYKHYYGDDKETFFEALGVPLSRDAVEFAEIDGVIEKISSDSDWVKKNRIQALHEAVILDYPSYILALAMGAGKTVLIGAIIATEFAMALRYPKGKFMKNALVFAPGTTIIESLRELSGMPYEKILPPDLHRDFIANLKIEFPSKGKEIQTQQGSSYNLIVTNTEKISLRANRRKNQQKDAFEREEVQANLRLQKIASLPNLGVFSDEAHHTYGNTFDKLKRVRETINYIHAQTPIVTVINTTGTPYYKKQILKEVIVWYGLGDGIKDNILKDLNNGIHQYDIAERAEHEVFDDIIREFFNTYGKVSLADGSKAKIAFYFKTQRHLDESRLLIERAMTSTGESVSQILVNTQTSSSAEIDDFKRLNNPANQKRVILLIGKGVEGWNCPSLFACALIKKQTSNNYVLQAATRCLRQVPGNQHSAKIFLDYGNAMILDKELQNNFGTDLDRLSAGARDKETVTLRILKTKLPKLEITRTVKRAVRAEPPNGKITLEKPKSQKAPVILRNILTPDFSGPMEILMPTGDTKELPAVRKTTDCHTAAWKIASRYHVPMMPALKQLNGLYPKGELPNNHLYGLFQQVETQQANYKTIEEKITEVLALIRVHDEEGKEIFEKDEYGVYVHHLRLLKKTYERMKDGGLLAANSDYADTHELSFHYTPYNFDSGPERTLFRQVLSVLNTNPDEVEAFLFTGGLTDPKKTDFHFEYMGEDKRYHRYFPDFVLVKNTGEFYIIEVKAENEKGDPIVEAKKKAVERLAQINVNMFRYHVIYCDGSVMPSGALGEIHEWVKCG
ncbi:DEAD/DEAH box helicase family protein [Candidatus Spongiihabitans sp.]|uniref:DEAD/DEAH box helicase family protein n=1 Tax=Candidatus Spongiihabitans sp. TaxID=3101308 RepID=UPI003C6F724B